MVILLDRYSLESTASRSTEKRFRIRPRGVASKKGMGLLRTWLIIPPWRVKDIFFALKAKIMLPVARESTDEKPDKRNVFQSQVKYEQLNTIVSKQPNEQAARRSSVGYVYVRT